jgi:hypothetical protein
MITSFCATTLVTPSLVTVFMMRAKKKGEEKKKSGGLRRVAWHETKKNWGNFFAACLNLCQMSSGIPVSATREQTVISPPQSPGMPNRP